MFQVIGVIAGLSSGGLPPSGRAGCARSQTNAVPVTIPTMIPVPAGPRTWKAGIPLLTGMFRAGIAPTAKACDLRLSTQPSRKLFQDDASE